MNPGSASIDRQDETQAPHWMQPTTWVTSIIDSGGTTYSRSGGSPSGRSQGVTRRIFAQCVDSMSVTRSLITGMFAIGSTTIGRAASSARLRRGAVAGRPVRRLARSWASLIWVLQPSVDSPLTFIPHEPQIAARHEQRTTSVPSVRSRTWSSPSSTERSGSRSTLNSCQYGPSPVSGWYLRTFSVYSGIPTSDPSQYVLSAGCHWVIVTGE